MKSVKNKLLQKYNFEIKIIDKKEDKTGLKSLLIEYFFLLYIKVESLERQGLMLKRAFYKTSH